MTMIFIVLATIAVHRICHYEDIFARIRPSWLDPAITPIPIAFTMAAVSLIEQPLAQLVLTACAVYPFLRVAVWAYQRYDPPAVGSAPKCDSCEAKRNEMQTLQTELRKWKKRIIISGASLVQSEELARNHIDWLIIFTTTKQSKLIESTTKLPNMMYRAIIDGDDSNKTLNDLMLLILNGGNATIVTYSNGIHHLLWKTIIERIGMMKAIAWVHVGTGITGPLPAHHRAIAPDEPLDTVIETTLAPA